MAWTSVTGPRSVVLVHVITAKNVSCPLLLREAIGQRLRIASRSRFNRELVDGQWWGRSGGVEEKDETMFARSISIAFLRVPFCEIGVWTYRFRGTWSLPRLERKIPLLIIFMACFYEIKRRFIFEGDLKVEGVFEILGWKFIDFTLNLFELKNVFIRFFINFVALISFVIFLYYVKLYFVIHYIYIFVYILNILIYLYLLIND